MNTESVDPIRCGYLGPDFLHILNFSAVVFVCNCNCLCFILFVSAEHHAILKEDIYLSTNQTFMRWQDCCLCNLYPG